MTSFVLKILQSHLQWLVQSAGMKPVTMINPSRLVRQLVGSSLVSKMILPSIPQITMRISISMAILSLLEIHTIITNRFLMQPGVQFQENTLLLDQPVMDRSVSKKSYQLLAPHH